MARLMPKKRTILGGTLLVGAAIGLWFSNLLPKLGSGFGLGSGGDSIVGKADIDNVAVQSGEAAKSKSSSDSSTSGRKPVRTEDGPPDDVFTILVEERHYAVWRTTRKGNGYFPTELDEIVQMALKTQPNDDGLRVRIVRSTTARITARQKLQAALVQAGVPAESILLQKDLVE